jgi:hypothetical protein
MKEDRKEESKNERSGWPTPSRIEVAERTTNNLVVKYRYHPLSEGRTRGLNILGIGFIGAGLITIVTGISEIVAGGIVIGALVLGLTWYYPRQCRTIVVDKKLGEISFSDSFSTSNQLPLNVPFTLVKGLTVASQTMASKPEHLLSLTLHPAPQGPFSIGHFTHLLVKSYDGDEIEEIARIISEFSDIQVIRQS